MARNFCVMTVGRSGSTSLMESLEKHADIMVPNKNIKCEDNELVHPKRLAEQMKQYAELCKKPIKTIPELIIAFYTLNKDQPYVGFKTMPNRHKDLARFTASKDIQFITLRRRDIASTCVSFLRASESGSWRRHGEEREDMWTFDPEKDAQRVASNVRYIFQSYKQLAEIKGAIHLYYEQLCDPDYHSPELDKYFERPIRMENPRPPTSGSKYVTNWDDFSKFVDKVWSACKKGGAATGEKKAGAGKNRQKKPAGGTDRVTLQPQQAAKGGRRRMRPDPSRRVFYAWELGMDLGHLLRFLGPALQLRERGYEVSFAVRDLSNAEATLGHHGFRIMQAPIWIANVSDLPKMTISYAEIALRYGFISHPGLKAMVKSWRELFMHVKPGLVLTDHSPSALLAARSMGLKLAPIGSGFFNPPMTRPLPSMRYWNNVPAERIEKPDTMATEIANKVLADMGGRRMESFADLFKGVENFLCTFQELDHYPNRGPARYWGPTFEVEQGVEMHFPKGEGKCIFAYIKPRYKDFEKLLETLRDSGCRVLAYCPGITKEHFDKYNSERLQISRTPLKLNAVIKDCDLVICHGGPGTVTASLLAGIPLLLLPTQLEQFMSTRRVHQLGAAIAITPPDKTKKEPEADHDYPKIIKQLLTEKSFRDKAGEFAKKYARFNKAHQSRMIASRIEELLRS